MDSYRTTSKEMFLFYVFKEQNIFVAKRFLSTVVEQYGKHQVLFDDNI